MNSPAHGSRIAVTGASGFVGSALVHSLEAAGAEVHRLVRRSPGPREIRWNPAAGTIDATALEGLDAVVHLAGENIAGLWTAAKRRRILESRARGTRLLATTLAELESPPSVLISASGVGYYGSAGDEPLTENSPPGDDFLARVCVEWESATDAAARAGIRVVRTRFGLVLDPSGGALRLMRIPFRFALGARLGSGRQWMSWISLPDVLSVIRFAIEANDLAGPVNAVSPHPVTNAEFTRLLASAVDRPAFLTVPTFALRTFTGGMADALLLTSQRAFPAVLLDRGFQFARPALTDVLAAPGVD